MNRKRIVLWSTFVLIGIAIVLAIVYAGRVHHAAVQAPPPGGKVKQGDRAPQFQALTTRGLFDLYKTNKPVFLEVFATWCPHCQRETAVIDKLYARYRGEVAFVGVSGSNTAMGGQSPSSDEDVLLFRDKFHVAYPIAYDGSLTVANAYLQSGFPTIAVIDRRKRISYLNSGEIGYGELNGAVKNAL